MISGETSKYHLIYSALLFSRTRLHAVCVLQIRWTKWPMQRNTCSRYKHKTRTWNLRNATPILHHFTQHSNIFLRELNKPTKTKPWDYKFLACILRRHGLPGCYAPNFGRRYRRLGLNLYTTLKTVAADSPEASVFIYQTKRHHVQQVFPSRFKRRIL